MCAATACLMRSIRAAISTSSVAHFSKFRPRKQPSRRALGRTPHPRKTRPEAAGLPAIAQGFSHFVTSMTAPVASGWSDLAGWDLHPPESAALSRRTPEVGIPARSRTEGARNGRCGPIGHRAMTDTFRAELRPPAGSPMPVLLARMFPIRVTLRQPLSLDQLSAFGSLRNSPLNLRSGAQARRGSQDHTLQRDFLAERRHRESVAGAAWPSTSRRGRRGSARRTSRS